MRPSSPGRATQSAASPRSTSKRSASPGRSVKGNGSPRRVTPLLPSPARGQLPRAESPQSGRVARGSNLRSSSPGAATPRTSPGRRTPQAEATSVDVSPSARALLHAARAKLEADRRARSILPGPGSYETNCTLNSSRAAISSFMSGSARSFNDNALSRRVGPDVGPATYNATKMRNGKNWSVAEGSGEHAQTASFRSTISTDPPPGQLNAGTPGPGAYDISIRNNGSNVGLADGIGDIAAWAFNSKVPKAGKLMWVSKVDTPGPGSYCSSKKLRDGSSGGIASGTSERPSCTFRSLSARGASSMDLARRTGPDVGPGAYNLNKLRDGNSFAMSGSDRLPFRRGSPAFMSDVPRDKWMNEKF